MVTSCSRSRFVVSICFLYSSTQTVRSLGPMAAAELCVNTAPSTEGSRFLGSAAEQPIINKWWLVCSKQKSSAAICQGTEEEGVTSPIRPMSLGILLIILIFFGKVMVPISFLCIQFHSSPGTDGGTKEEWLKITLSSSPPPPAPNHKPSIHLNTKQEEGKRLCATEIPNNVCIRKKKTTWTRLSAPSSSPYRK